MAGTQRWCKPWGGCRSVGSSTAVWASGQLSLRLGEAGVEPEDIQAIFITHEHGDPTGCALTLARRHRIAVWMSHGTYLAMGSPEPDLVQSVMSKALGCNSSEIVVAGASSGTPWLQS